MQYDRDLKKKLCEGICLNGLSTLKTANEYNVPIKTLKKWVTAFNKDNHCFDPIIETVSDFRLIDGTGNVNIEDYIYHFNYKRPQVALNYLTPMQFKNLYYIKYLLLVD